MDDVEASLKDSSQSVQAILKYFVKNEKSGLTSVIKTYFP